MKQQMDALAGVKELEQELHEMYGNQVQNKRKPEDSLNASDLFEKQKELRVERQRIK